VPPLPTFLIGGTEPAGLNFLFTCLAQHPDVYLPPFLQPEPNFFSKEREHARGLGWYQERYFAAWKGQAAVGEKSGRYLYSPQAPARIAAALPDVKVIFVLRHPVERAHSNWRFTAQAGFEWLSFPEALRREEERNAAARDDPRWREVLPHAYFHKGLYAEQLERWLGHVPRERLLVLQSEALKRRAPEELRRAFAFLGVDPAAPVDPGKASDFPSSQVRSLRLQRLLRRLFPARLDAALMQGREGKARPDVLGRLIRLNLAATRAPLEQATRAELLARYAEPTARLFVRWPELDRSLWEGV
jgi:hypothetical protein